jgi:phosphodiesterase/alkaline phosphatase D-like protein
MNSDSRTVDNREYQTMCCRDTLLASLFVFLSCCGQALAAPEGLYLGSGVKAGEITDSRAIVHVRLTSVPEQDERGLIPGREGQARLSYGLDAELDAAASTAWRSATADEDFSIQFQLENLQANRRYYYRVEYRVDERADSRRSQPFSFKTAPAADMRAAVRFQVTTGQDVRGEETYVAMAAQRPDFLVSTGDNVYYDGAADARDVPGAYAAYQQMYGLPKMKEYFYHVAGYFEKDDHDYRFNDADRWQTVKGGDGGRRSKKKPAKPQKWLSHDEGIMVFKQVFPMSDPTYRTFRWGQGVQIWLLEGRDFRSPNGMPDGPDKTLWGREQLQWLKSTLQASQADWRIVISPTPIIGPDRVTKTDNHANPRGFWTEGQAFLDWIKENQLDNVILACGDRHWQYHVVDRRNDRQIHEFSCGPTCDEHTQAVPPIEGPFVGIERPYSASKGGFLTVTYLVPGAIRFEFFNAVGNLLYQREFQR